MLEIARSGVQASHEEAAELKSQANTNLDEIFGLCVKVLEFWRQCSNIDKSVAGHVEKLAWGSGW